jgi:hypothetical protein
MYGSDVLLLHCTGMVGWWTNPSAKSAENMEVYLCTYSTCKHSIRLGLISVEVS